MPTSLPLTVALLLGTTACPGDDVPPITGEGSTTGDDTTTAPPVTVTVTVTDTTTNGTMTATETVGVDSTEGTTEGTTTAGPSCGDDVAEGREQCDGTDLAGEGCASQGFDAGELACADDCTFDTSGCMLTPVCGNDVVDGKDVCDGTDLGGEDCTSQGFGGGTLVCLADCSGYDTSACSSCEDEDIGSTMGPMVSVGDTTGEDDDLDPTCGGMGGNDHVIRFTAPADGAYIFDTAGSDYDTTLALFAACDAGSEIICNDDSPETPQSELQLDMTAGQTVYVVIDGFSGDTGLFVLNISEVPACGDGMVTGGEVCDGADVGGATCADAGLTGAGAIVCAPDCSQLDAPSCDPPTGYGNCGSFPLAETCTAEEVCATDGALQPSSVCLELDCATVMDCAPAPATGTAPVTCMDVSGDGLGDCYLSCGLGETCPDNMGCFFGFICLWTP